MNYFNKKASILFGITLGFFVTPTVVNSCAINDLPEAGTQEKNTICHTPNEFKDYIIFEKDLRYITDISSKIDLYEDCNNTAWYVRPKRFYEVDKNIFAVVVSNILKHLSPETFIPVKFVIGTEEDGETKVIGTASQKTDFVSLSSYILDHIPYKSETEEAWRGRVQSMEDMYQKTYGAEKQYTFWMYLGFPVPSSQHSGILKNGQVIRVDYGNAFRSARSFEWLGEEKPELLEKNCFQAEPFQLESHSCDINVMKGLYLYIISNTSNAAISKLVSKPFEVLKELNISNISFGYQSAIENYLKDSRNNILALLSNSLTSPIDIQK